MSTELVVQKDAGGALAVPDLIHREGPKTAKRFLEFFTANIRNENTRAAYARAVSQFLDWCDRPGVTLKRIEPMKKRPDRSSSRQMLPGGEHIHPDPGRRRSSRPPPLSLTNRKMWQSLHQVPDPGTRKIL